MIEEQTIPLVDLRVQYQDLKKEIDAALTSIAERASFIKGPDHKAFAEEFSAFCGGGHTALCGNGTDALYLALHETVGSGDGTEEIVTTSHTFIATAEAIVRAGYKPVFVDIDPESCLMDVRLLEQAIGPKTKAILPVHLYGRMVKMDQLMDIANKYDLTVIEDAAQAHGAQYKGKGPGQWGAAACFSFFPGKNLGAFGDAGAVFSQDRGLIERIRSFSDHGREAKYIHNRYGVNSRLDGLQAAILRVKLPHLAKWNSQRSMIASRYTELLAANDAIECPSVCPDSSHVYHLYVIKLRDEATRDTLLAGLKSEKIMAGIHYPVPVHEQPAFKYLEYASNAFPHTSEVAKRVLSLPIFPGMSNEQIERVASVLMRLV